MIKNCIYKIEIPGTEHIYIGSTKAFQKRRREHLHDLLKHKHDNKLLQKAFDTYRHIKFVLLELCEYKELIDREQYYINSYKPDLNKYKKAGGRQRHYENGKWILMKKLVI